MAFPKGQKNPNAGRKPGTPNPNGGRPKGAKNKIPHDVKENIIKVFEALNPDDRLPHMTAWANRDAAGFYALYAKMLPKNVDVAVSGTIGLTGDASRMTEDELSAALERVRAERARLNEQ